MNVKLRFGMSVQTHDGPIGNLERIVMASDGKQPLQLMLYPGRALPRQDVIAVPINLVTCIARSRIVVAASREELAAVCEREPSAAVNGPTWELAGGVTVVDAAGRSVGQLQGVVLNSTQCVVSHLMVRHQEYHLAPQNRLVPMMLIADITPEAVRLHVAADYDLGIALTDPW